MTKVRIERCLIKRSCETFFELEREFEYPEDAEDYMGKCVDLYYATGRVRGYNDWGKGCGYELILIPSYHRVYIEVVV